MSKYGYAFVILAGFILGILFSMFFCTGHYRGNKVGCVHVGDVLAASMGDSE